MTHQVTEDKTVYTADRMVGYSDESAFRRNAGQLFFRNFITGANLLDDVAGKVRSTFSGKFGPGFIHLVYLQHFNDDTGGQFPQGPFEPQHVP